MSKRRSAAQRLQAEIDQVFAGGEDLAGAIQQVAVLDARLLLQAAIEAEVTAYLGRDRYERAAGCEDARAAIDFRQFVADVDGWLVPNPQAASPW